MQRVGVLLGGPSSEHDISLLSGMNVLRTLQKERRYEAVPIFITKNGAWLFGKDRAWMNPTEALMRVDRVFNALHGEYGEDGQVQGILNHVGVSYTGSGALASALAMNKMAAQRVLEGKGIKMPRSLVLGPHNLDTRAVLAFSAPPWIVKPLARGSSVGVSKVETHDDLVPAFKKAFAVDNQILAQEFIQGREITCGVLENDRAEIQALPPIEIIPPEDAPFFDYQVKYNGRTQEICPADFHDAMLTKIKKIAMLVHEALGLRHYSRTDMILKPASKTRGAPEVYVLEVNTLPGLTQESLFPKAARALGIEFGDLVHHLLGLARVA